MAHEDAYEALHEHLTERLALAKGTSYLWISDSPERADVEVHNWDEEETETLVKALRSFDRQSLLRALD